MKWVIAALVLLILVLLYELWFANGGVLTVLRLKQDITQQQLVNQKLEKRNQVLRADILDLKSGDQAVEERARDELGMVKRGETFYQVIKHPDGRR